VTLPRRALLKAALGAAAGASLAAGSACSEQKGQAVMSSETNPSSSPSGASRKGGARMPALFVGHGSPMNAIEDNQWSRALRGFAKELPRPKAVLCVSAHWYTAGTFVTGNERPETIHDFGGFPDELFQVQYPAPGDVALAQRAVALAGQGNARATLRTDWGLDHGTWSVLVHLLPKADVPVVQLSIDGRLPYGEHLAIGKALAPLRDEGVLILGSGNVTHNLRHAFGSMRSGNTVTPDWARSFDEGVVKALAGRDHQWLAKAPLSEEGRLSHPTPDHYLPLLYAVGASTADEQIAYPVTGFDAASLSMRSVRFG
jgi:4,5-DOPA dioxygenase extradiol